MVLFSINFLMYDYYTSKSWDVPICCYSPMLEYIYKSGNGLLVTTIGLDANCTSYLLGYGKY